MALRDRTGSRGWGRGGRRPARGPVGDVRLRYEITCVPTTLLSELGHVVRRLLGTAMNWEVENAFHEVL